FPRRVEPPRSPSPLPQRRSQQFPTAATDATSRSPSFPQVRLLQIIHADWRSVGAAAALLRRHAAIQGKDGAGGESAFVAGKKQDAGRDLLGRAEPAEQLPRRQRLTRGGGIDAFLENFVEIRRVDRAWRDRVATDAVADVIDGDGAR